MSSFEQFILVFFILLAFVAHVLKSTWAAMNEPAKSTAKGIGASIIRRWLGF